MRKLSYIVGMGLMVGMALVIIRMGMSPTQTQAAEIVTPKAESSSVADSGMSEAEWRFRTQQPNHWRQVMLVR